MFYFILYLLLDVIPLLLILLPLLILWQRLCYKNKQISRYLLLILFSGYLFAVFNLTGFPCLGTCGILSQKEYVLSWWDLPFPF